MLTWLSLHESAFITCAYMALAIFLALKAPANLIMVARNARRVSSEKNLLHYKIEKLRLLVFIKVFANCLTVVFFPSYLLRLTVLAHAPETLASFAYVMYQLFFILMLIPGGYLSEVKSSKRLLLIATFAEGIIFLMFGLTSNLWIAFGLQIIFGCVVPLSSSAEYAYLFSVSPPEERNVSLASYANSLKGASIAGILAGGLLASRIGGKNVFFVSSLLMGLATLYALWIIPTMEMPKNIVNARRGSSGFQFMIRQLPTIFKHPEFLKTIFCVGLPLGLLDDGIILFSMPLLLSYYHYSHEHIAQLLVLVSLGFFIFNKSISFQADQQKKEKPILILGLLGMAASLALFAFSSFLGIFAMATSLFLIGIFRGFLVAPGIAYLSQTPIAQELGKNVSLSVYRLVQTAGSIIGPILMMSLLTSFHYHSGLYFCLTGLFILFAIILGVRYVPR
jgi:MFS family permease